MAQLLNSSSNSPVRVGRKAEEIVFSIQRLIESYPNSCWYNGCWSFGGRRPVVFPTKINFISLNSDGVWLEYENPYGDYHCRRIPCDSRLLSRLRDLQQKIWVATWKIAITRKSVPAWAISKRKEKQCN